MVKTQNIIERKNSDRQQENRLSSLLKGSGLKTFARLGNILLKEGKIPAAISSYYRGLKQVTNKADRGWEKKNCVEAEFIIDRKYNFIYCPIAKVASSSMKRMAIELSDLKNKTEILKLPKESIHAYVSHTLTLAANYSYLEAMEILEDSKYFKFVIVRNPWERLASAYLNKFVWNRDFQKPDLTPKYIKKVIQDVYNKQGLEPNYQRSITFREFVDYLCDTEDSKLNGHWCPQYLYLGKMKYDLIGKVENLSQDFEYIKTKLNLEIDLPWTNKTQKKQEHHDRNYSDYRPLQLSELERLPGDRQLYTPDLIELVAQKYRQDIEMFDYNFAD
ncbi:MAG: sulfotransferase family protein [Prochloraceae cyanobacterium]